MHQKVLLKIALVCVFVGLFLLYVFSETIDIDYTAISKINNAESGEKIKIIGIVSEVYSSDNAVFIKVTKAETAEVVVFKQSNENITINYGDVVEIIGRTEDYNGKREIIADRIRKVE